MKCIHSDWIYTGRRFGTLYSCVVPDSANLIGRLSAVVRHCASHSTAALIGRAGIKAALGYSIMACGGSKGTCPSARRGALAVLRTKLYGSARKRRWRPSRGWRPRFWASTTARAHW